MKVLQPNGSPEQTDARRRLALAISAKGVPTDAKASFIQMAENVAQIPQQYSDGESYFASFVMPEEYMFNVFGICEKMIGENPHPEFPAFFVAEYYRGYDSLVLTGADAYLTCDGDFYQTLDKTAEVTHVWHDADNGKSNRYVVFYYMQDGYTFANSTVELCPRRVALAGRCASFIITGENRLTDVYVLGTLENFSGGTKGVSWNPAQVIRNYVEHSGGTFYASSSIKSSVFPELVRLIGGSLYSEMPEHIVLPNLVLISGGTIATIAKANAIISAPNLKYIRSHIWDNDGVEKILFESLEEVSGDYFAWSINLVKEMHFPKLKRFTPNRFYLYGGGSPNLIDFEVGELVYSINLRDWYPNVVLSTPEGIATINANIRDHIAAKVSDRTGDSALTFTVSANLYANLEQATIDAFTAKNWNVAGA